MRIDLAKIFPTSCREQGLSDICIESIEIRRFFVDITGNAVAHVVQVGDVEYRFSDKDGGIAHIFGIVTMEQTLSLYQSNKTATEAGELLREQFDEIAKTNLKQYAVKFGCSS